MSVGMSLVFNAHFYFSPTARFQWGYSTLKSVEISSKISSTRGGVPALVRGTEGPSEARCCWREKWSGAGLLNLPALFALADFHLFSVIYAALSCAAMCTFAGYSAPRIRHRYTSANRLGRPLQSRFIQSVPERRGRHTLRRKRAAIEHS